MERVKEKLLRIKEAAEYLDVSHHTLYHWVNAAHRDGEVLRQMGKTPIPFRRVGRCVRFCRQELDEWSKANGNGEG